MNSLRKPQLQKLFIAIIPIALFLALYYLYAGLTFNDFGITWDELDVYSTGKLMYEHLFARGAPDNPALVFKTGGQEIKAVYNYLYSTTLYILNPRQTFAGYHLLNMLFGSLAFIAAYAMLFKKYKNGWLALIGPIFLVCMPRFFGDLPANPKDATFAVMYLVVIGAIYVFSEIKNTYARIFVFAVLCGVLQSMRVVGMAIYVVMGAYDTYRFVAEQSGRLSIKKLLIFWIEEAAYLATIFGLASLITLISWPYASSSFFKHFRDIMRTSRDYPWHGSTLTHGTYMQSNRLPWHYLPTWIIATTPLFIQALFVGGVFSAFKKNFRNPVYFLVIFALILNFSIYYISHPTIYDGLRHFMFTLPLFAMVAAVFFIEILRKSKKMIKIGTSIVVFLSIFGVFLSYIQLHPYEYVYFNEAVGGLSGAVGKYETDYWGASFREANLWLREKTRNERDVTVFTCAHPFISTYYFGPHMIWVDDTKKADYSICYTRGDEHKKLISGDIIHTVSRQGVNLNYITKNPLPREKRPQLRK